MGNIEQWVAENSILIACAFGALFVLVMIFMGISSAKKKGRKNKLLQENPNLVEIEFDNVVMKPRPISGPLGNVEGYTLFAVNGQEAQVFNRSVIVPAGEVTLDCEYCYQTMGKNFATSCGRSYYRFTAVLGIKYLVFFNFMEMKMDHKEAARR